jgi:16S rRNA (cytosine1402-N4)-methyltransferase
VVRATHAWQVAVSDAEHGHEPVLVEAVLRLLDPQPGHIVLDATVGLGGHAAAILPRIAPAGRYIGLDVDESMLEIARRQLIPPPNVTLELVQTSYVDFPDVLGRQGITTVDHILADFGLNSQQLDDPARGFSFERDGPLDMRFNRRQKETAMDLVNRLSERELADLFYEFGQEGASRKIARKICEVRHEARITSTTALARAVESIFASGHVRQVGKVHPATRVFQALRVAVNRELDNVERLLTRAADYLRPGGRIAVISFHSLEDAIAKRVFRGPRDGGVFEEMTRRPEVAEPAERNRNPRSRSAKLRVARRLA